MMELAGRRWGYCPVRSWSGAGYIKKTSFPNGGRMIYVRGSSLESRCAGPTASAAEVLTEQHFGRGHTEAAGDHGRFLRMLRRLLIVSILILAAMPFTGMTAGAADAPSG